MKTKKLSKKLISIILTIMMLATMIPATSVHTHAAVDNSGVTLEYCGTEVADNTIINKTNQKVKVYTITDNGEYVLKTSSITQYGVAIILDAGASDIRLVLDNVNIEAQMPIMPGTVNGINYNNSIQGGFAIYNSGDELSNLDIYIKGSNIINVSDVNGNATSAMLVRGCNTIFYGESEENNLNLFNNSSNVSSHGLVNLTKDGYVGGSVPFETAPFLGFYDGVNVSVDVQQGEGIITARDINMFNSRLFIHSYGIGLQSYVDEGILENGYYGLYVENSTLSVDTSGAGIGINNGGAAFVDGTDVNINVTGIALTVCSGNITFDNINNVDIRSNDGYGLSLNDSTLSVDFNSDNVSIYGERYAIMGMSQYVTTRGFVGDNEIITLHSDDGIDYSEYTDDVTTKKYVKTSTRAHTHDFGEDYYESDVAGYHYMLCACGEMSEPEECTYSFHYFESAPDIENDGVKVYFCDYCGGRKDVTVPAHDCNAYTNFQIDENGNHYGNCTYEGCERYIDEPHNLELLEELDENSHKHICAACGYYEAEDHLFVEFEFIDEDTHEAYCECGYTGVKPHDYIEYSGNNDGLTHTGYCECGATVTEDHSWGEWIETDNGYMHSCDGCGAVDYCSHEWSGWSYDDVMHSRQCTICPAVEENEHHSEAGFIDMGIGHYMICDECEMQISLPHEYEKCGNNGDGTHTKYCFCGATVTEEHNWGDWEEAADGSGTFHTCNDCHTTEYCSHEWSEWYGISNLQHQHQCEICGTTKDSRHTWGNWTDLGAEHSHECSGCGWRITEEHDYINIWDDENGTTHTAYCICGKGITSEHDWSPWIDTEDGQHRRECNECGAEEIGEHNWGEWESINEESHQRFCLDCETARQEASHNLTDNWVDIGEEGHRLGCVDCEYGTVKPHEIHENIPNEDGKTHTGYCFCGAVITVPHTWGECIESEDGHTRLCTGCTYSVDEEHNLGEYSKDGVNHTAECADCHAIVSEGHTYGDYEYVDGETHQRNCSVCNYTEVTAHKPNLLGYKDNSDGTHYATCGKCSKKYYVEHTYVCGKYDEEKHTLSCDECDAWEFENHDWSDWEITEDGKHHRECLDCGYEQSDNHTYGDYVYIDNHTHERICSVCNYVESEKHRYHSIKGCTDNGDGTHTYECTRCSEKITVEHTLTYDKYNSEKHVITCGDCKLEVYEIHNWSEWELSIDGSRNRYCLDCGEQQSCYHENKTYTESDGQKHKVTCDNCGWCYSELHEYEEFISQGDGTHKSACRCGYWFMEDHFYICEDNGDGTHTGTCGCGDVVTESHNYDFETVILREPTEGRPGSKREYCSCGAYKNSNFVSYYDANGDNVVDEMDYQLLINEILQDANEQSGTAEYDEIIKYDLDGDGYLDVLDAAIMALVVNGHKSIWEVQNTTRGDFDLDGVAFTDDDLVGMYYALWDIEASAPTLSTSQKFAADLNCNGRLDEDDLVKLKEDYPHIGSLIYTYKTD